MKRICCAMLALAFLIPAGLAALAVTVVEPSTVSAADKKVRTSVTGAGESKDKAETEAEKAATQISFIHSIISKNTTGSGKNYICTMIIEYTPK